MPQPKTVKQIKRFAGMINCYRDLWKQRAHHLAPIMNLTKGKKKGPIAWSEAASKAFNDIKEIVAKDALLHYPNFNKRFDIHTDSSDYQMGAIISQNKRPIAY